MENKNNSFFKSMGSKIRRINDKNKYIEPVFVIGLSLATCFGVLTTVQGVMGTTESLEITTNKAEEYYYDGKYDEAIAEYMKMQETDNWPIWTVKAAEVYSIKGDITQSNNLLKEAMVKRDKLMGEEKDKYLEQDKELVNNVIFDFYVNGEVEQASSLGEYYIEEYSTYKPLLKTMLAVYMSENDMESAKNIVKSYPVDSESAYDLAELAKMKMVIGDYNEGLNFLKKANSVDKNEVKILDVIMETVQFNKKELVDEINKLVKENSNDETYKLWLDKINLTENDTDNVAENIDEYLNYDIEDKDLKEDSYVAEYKEAWDSYKNSKYDKALEYAKKCISINPEYGNAYGILIPEIMIATDNATKVEGYFRTAIYMEPYNYNLIASIAKIYEDSLNDYEKAKEYCSLALKLNDKEDALYYDLALLNVKEQKEEEAILDLQKAISIDSNNGEYYRALGTVYYNEKEYDKAIENIRKAYSINEKDVLTLNNAACYYIMIENDIWRGYQNIESAYKDMPNNLDVKSKEIITKNYEAVKKIYDEFVNNEEATVNIPVLELSY